MSILESWSRTDYVKEIGGVLAKAANELYLGVQRLSDHPVFASTIM